MTCIVGLEYDGRVYMGADSSAALGWEVRSTRIPKVFEKDEFIIGYTTSFRMGQILQYHLDVPTQKAGIDDLAYMVGVFVEGARECLKNGGFTKVENNREEGGCFLVSYRGRLYVIDGDFQVNSSTDKFEAIGCGREYALGAMKALEREAPHDVIKHALEIASHFSGGVCPPFEVIVR